MATGSTLYTALGFDTLKKEKEHFNIFVKKHPEQVISTDVQKYLDFGNENAIHAISTIVGLLLPALKPCCFSFYEVGPKFIHGQTRKNLIEVSADGIIMCTLEDKCPNKDNFKSHRWVAVEINSMYPSDDCPKFPNYKLPVQLVPKVLCEMVAFKCDELWLVTFTLCSVTLVIVYYSDTLWQKLLKLTEEKYGCEKPVYPTQIHSFCKELRKEMMNFVETHSYIVCEVPSFHGELKMNLPPLFVNPYACTGMFLQSVPNYKEYTKIILTIAEECTSLFPKIHNVMRMPAIELLMFMINNKDRLQNGNVPSSLPLAYAMKGRCMSNKELRHLINTVWNSLKERNIPILVECYDGQWQKTVMMTEEGKPLNKLRLVQNIWSHISRLSKSKLIDEMSSISKINLGDRDLISLMRFPVGSTLFDNIEVHRIHSGAIHVSSRGGPLYKVKCGQYVITPMDLYIWIAEAINESS